MTILALSSSASVKPTLRSNIEFLLWHLEQPTLPRMIATLITRGGQFPAYTIENIISAFERSERKDCRINAFPFNPDGKLQILPSLLFIEVDILDLSAINKVLRRMKKILHISHPTVLFSGNKGYHIIQPMDASKFFESAPAPEWFIEAQNKKWDGFAHGAVSEFLIFAEKFLSGELADDCHRPTIKSCLLRPPGTINSKSNKEVTILQEWDGRRPPVELLLGEYYTTKLAEYNEHKRKELEREAWQASGSSRTNNFNIEKNKNAYFDWYVPLVLETPLPDFRERIMSMVIVPYLRNIKKLPEEEVYEVTEAWLMQCNKLHPLAFDYSLVWQKIRNADLHQYVPMGHIKLLSKMLRVNPEAHLTLQTKLFANKNSNNIQGGENKEK